MYQANTPIAWPKLRNSLYYEYTRAKKFPIPEQLHQKQFRKFHPDRDLLIKGPGCKPFRPQRMSKAALRAGRKLIS